ncbi:MAG: hypothetical protein QOJ87_97 [Verrucomicrobiota bacterium]
MKAQDGVLVVEIVHVKAVHIVEAKRGESGETKNEIAPLVDLRRNLPEMNLRGENGKYVAIRFGLNVATPEIELEYLGIVK